MKFLYIALIVLAFIVGSLVPKNPNHNAKIIIGRSVCDMEKIDYILQEKNITYYYIDSCEYMEDTIEFEPQEKDIPL